MGAMGLVGRGSYRGVRKRGNLWVPRVRIEG